MPAYHFEGVCDCGFQVSGMLEAENDSQARKKAQRFFAANESIMVSEIEVARPGRRPDESGVRQPGAGPSPAAEARKTGPGFPLLAGWLGRRPLHGG